MSALALALQNLCRDMSVDRIAEAAKAKRSTAGNMKADLNRQPPELSRWDGDRIEAMATWERNAYGTSSIADALKGVESEFSSLEDIRSLMETAQRLAASIEGIAKATEDQKVTHPEWEQILSDAQAARAMLTQATKLARKRLSAPRR